MLSHNNIVVDHVRLIMPISTTYMYTDHITKKIPGPPTSKFIIHTVCWSNIDKMLVVLGKLGVAINQYFNKYLFDHFQFLLERRVIRIRNGIKLIGM